MGNLKPTNARGPDASRILPDTDSPNITPITLKQVQQQFLDSRLFRAFMAAAETENFTSAAKSTFMTQSGISQQIARLEEQVGLPLFKRVAKHVTLTRTGMRLKKYIEEHRTQTATFLSELREEYNGIAGSVSYAVPPSYMLSPHFQFVLEIRKQYAMIRLNVKLAQSQDIFRMVLNDQVDFGLVTRKSDHPNLSFTRIFQEEYILTASSAGTINEINDKTIYEQPCIAYPDVDVYFNSWLKYSFPRRKNLDFLSLRVSGTINSIDGAIKMVQVGMGISVFPRHCVDELLAHNQLFEFNTRRPPLLNDIYIVSLRNYAYPRAIRQVMAWFY